MINPSLGLGELERLGYSNIIEGRGFELSFAGLTIVFISLVAVSGFIRLLPILLAALDSFFPPGPEEAAVVQASGPEDAEVAAIAFAIVEQRKRG